MRRYVLGFGFTENRALVAMIRKIKPDWQAGLINGIGGKIETSDVSPAHAMSREFFEETGVHIHTDQWQEFCVMRGDDSGKTEEQFEVVVFRAFTDKVRDVRTTTDEHVELVPVSWFPRYKSLLVSNVNWLATMALDENYGHPFTATITYRKPEVQHGSQAVQKS